LILKINAAVIVLNFNRFLSEFYRKS